MLMVVWPRGQSSKIQVVWNQGNQIEVGFRHFLVCATILKPSTGSLKCVSCSLESGALMNSGMKPNSKGLERLS